MTIQEFIKDNNMNHKNMVFKYDYFTRNTFFSFAHIESCRRERHIIPTKTWYIEDNKLYIKCNIGKRIISFENFIKRDYPRDLETYFITEDTTLELNTTGSTLKYKGDPDTWKYDLDEV